MLRPIALLALTFAACASTSNDMQSCPLVGTWERRIAMDDWLASFTPNTPPPLEYLVRTETFDASGNWSTLRESSWAIHCGNEPPFVRSDGVAYGCIFNPERWQRTWDITRCNASRIEVDLHEPDNATEHCMFEVVSADELRTSDEFGPFRMVRVKDAK